jgi:nicotinamidase-related amidase
MQTQDADSAPLVVIDAQRAFMDPDSPWFVPAFEERLADLSALVRFFEPNTIFTRFVPPRVPHGSWREYYRKWSFAVAPGNDHLWDLVAPWTGLQTVDVHTFSKWGDKLQAAIGHQSSLVLCGVSTDCCVMATALAAIDAGVNVRVVEDACAAKTPELHERALLLLSSRAPQLSITTVEREVSATPIAPRRPRSA